MPFYDQRRIIVSQVRRIYAEKRPGYDVAAQQLCRELCEVLGTQAIERVRVFQRYDVEGLGDAALESAKGIIFSEPNVDVLYDENLPQMDAQLLAVEYLPGQYDQRADSASQCLQLLSPDEARPKVVCAKVYAIEGCDITQQMMDAIAAHLINPVESRRASMDKPDTLTMHADIPADVATVEGFITMGDKALSEMVRSLGMAMSAEDLCFCRDYFRDTEKRDPSITELRAIDTYWSDHCRHTTFLTAIDGFEFEDGRFAEPIRAAYELYIDTRKDVYGERKKDVSLMDMATLGAKALRKMGKLDDLDASEEINACSIVVTANVDGKEEPWLIMFKNETHNHPTEIEGFGGAATCLGGAIRDPLSGRSYVYQAMRITGSGDPRMPYSRTRQGKLPQRRITTTAAAGYSSYGNQIGLAAGKVQEYYHPGFVAKRLELGAVIAATPRDHVRRAQPAPGDVVMLLGGRTGRDGCGGATGSSKAHSVESLSACGAEVQKGNPPTERCIQRLFRNAEFAQMVKRCNDFGAGGVCVAVGELAAGLVIELDQVPKKYEGLDGTELAISESQERMACVIEADMVERFKQMAYEENLEATQVATVTEEARLVMHWRGKTIVDLSRAFLDTNGVTQHASAVIAAPDEREPYLTAQPAFVRGKNVREAWLAMLGDLNICSQKGMIERFDGTIGASTILAPFGGLYRESPNEAMAALIPTDGETTTATLMSHGYDPYLSEWSPFHGAVYAVTESLAKIAAAGGDVTRARLTFQEYFEKLAKVPQRWGKPAAALLGGLSAQLGFGTASIGGKDSMSGTFEDIHVPPTLVSFAVNAVEAKHIISTDFKAGDHRIALLRLPVDEHLVPLYDQALMRYDLLRQAIENGDVLAAHTVGRGGIAAAATMMAMGSRIGFSLDAVHADELFLPLYGSIVCELADGAPIPSGMEVIGFTSGHPVITVQGMLLPLEEARSAWVKPLESVFPTTAPAKHSAAPFKPFVVRNTNRPALHVAKPRVFIPSFPGTNCELDSAKAFRRAGAQVDTFIFRNLTAKGIEESVDAIVKGIENAQIVMLPGGFSAGDEPDGSGKFIATALRNPRIMDAIHALLDQRDGLMLGICNGFQALIKLGLVPYGEIRTLAEDDPTLTYNTIGRHAATHVRTVVSSVKSPWMAGVHIGDVHEVAISHGEGRFVCREGMLRRLQENGQIITQYCDEYGIPAAQMPDNPNGSYWAVEGICSPDGRVLGKMGHSERIGAYVAGNIPGNKDQKIFESGVKYFL
ncbi:MAG: phosphoribosylformylglycinamidine synthase [Clostridia bacterium]|nr:phosphoribosylformylglycinamidine synthase [Clostridia bacterium]